MKIVVTHILIEFLQISGPLTADWLTALLFNIRAFLFPEDQHIDLEYWAETGEFSSTEPSQVKVRHIPSLSKSKFMNIKHQNVIKINWYSDFRIRHCENTVTKHEYFFLTIVNRVKTTVCSASLPVLGLCSLASTGQCSSATGRRIKIWLRLLCKILANKRCCMYLIIMTLTPQIPHENDQNCGDAKIIWIPSFTVMTLPGRIGFLFCSNSLMAERSWYGATPVKCT